MSQDRTRVKERLLILLSTRCQNNAKRQLTAASENEVLWGKQISDRSYVDSKTGKPAL